MLFFNTRAIFLAVLAWIAILVPFYAHAQMQPNFTNLLIGDDYSTNLYQGAQCSAVTSTATYCAEQNFAFGGASSSITTSTTTSGMPTGFQTGYQFVRTAANANTAAITNNQILTTADTVKTQGQTICFEDIDFAGANFSAASGIKTINFITGTGTDQGASSLAAGTWTGQATVATFNEVLTSIAAKHEFCFTQSSTATEMAVQESFIPVGTAGTVDGFVDIIQQLHIVNLPLQQAILQEPTFPFERVPAAIDAGRQLAFFHNFAEPANGVVAGYCQTNSANTQDCALPLSPPMRAIPTATVSSGTWKVNVVGTPTAVTLTAATSTTQSCNVTGATTAAAGTVVSLQGGGGTGFIACSARE